MASLTSYGPLLGGYRSIASDRLWERSSRRAGASDEVGALPFDGRTPPRRKELPEDLLQEQGSSGASWGKSSPASPTEPTRETPLRDSELAFMLDFQAPFLRAITREQSPSDVVFRERAVYWDLAPARAAYGKLLYRQNSFFVNRKQDSGLGSNLNSFW